MGKSTSKFNRTLERVARAGLALVVAGIFSACGGGGGEREFDSASSSSGAASTSVAKVELKSSSPSMSSDGRQVLKLYATVKNAANVALSGVSVNFSTPDSGATIAVPQAVTDVNGQVEASLSISDPSNRSVQISATAAQRSATTSVSVVGTTTAISGPGSIALGIPAQFKVVVTDASGARVVGKEVSVRSVAGNTVSVNPALTDEQGTVAVTLTSSSVGADTLTASAAGAIGQVLVKISSKSIAFASPLPAAEVVVSNSQAVSVLVRDSGSPLPAAPVNFTATRGTFSPPQTQTAGDGTAASSIRSDYAGRSILTATTADGILTSQELQFVGGPTEKLELQAWPTSVGVTLPGSAPETSQVIAIVRDAKDNPVKGVRVNFSVLDPSNGLGLSEGYAISDALGRATVVFYPGSLPTGAEEVVLTASTIRCTTLSRSDCVKYSLEQSSAYPQLVDHAQVTVGKRALQLRIGTGNEVEKIDNVYNEVPYGVLVTDSAGNPVPRVSLGATVVSVDYNAGDWIFDPPCVAGRVCWYFVGQTCPGEDVNRNLRLDAGEDINQDGVLTPGNVAVTYFGQSGAETAGLTDDKGSAILRVRYPRDRSRRVTVSLHVTASMPDGTEGSVSTNFLLPMLAEDVTSVGSPPGASGAAVGYGSTCP